MSEISGGVRKKRVDELFAKGKLRALQFERLERNVLGGNEEFASKGMLRGAAAKCFFGADFRDIGIVVFLGDVSEDEVTCARVKAIRIRKIFTDSVIRKMAGTGENALLDDPGVGADLEHVEIVVGFEDEAISIAQMNFDEFRHIAEVGADGGFGAVSAEGEADGVGGIVRDGKGMNIDIADDKALTGLNGFDSAEAFAESVWKDALERSHGGFGDIEGGFPETQDLGQAVAVVGVFVGD